MTIEQTVSKPQKAILKSRKSVNLFLGGVGSGKTYLGGIISYLYVSKFPRCRGFIGANTYMQLNQSTLFRIREYWKSIGITEYDSKGSKHGFYVVNKKPPAHFSTEGHSFDDYYGIISFINGAIIFIGSLDNASAHYGKEFSWSILDETKDSDEEDVKEVILTRMRQKGIFINNGELADNGMPFNPLYILTSPAKSDWINEWFSLEKHLEEIASKIYSDKTYFHKEFDNKCVIISSTYHNQINLPDDYIERMRLDNSEERFKALIYANPFTMTGGEFYSSFNRLEHVGIVKYNPDLPIHITFDQNSVPYNSASLWQVRRDTDIWLCGCIDEIVLPNPRNSTEEVCEEFILRYPNHKGGLFYYGDASGKNRSTMNKDFKHHYEIVEYKLRRYISNNSDRTALKNPSVVKRRDFINLLFENKLPIRILIDEGCKYVINDFMYVKQALDGTKDKHIVTDKTTGERYQKYCHLSDGCDYLLTELFKQYYNG